MANKTYEQWNGSGRNFDDFFHPGDTVDSETVNHMGGTVPPASASPDYLQCGEPYSHRADDESRSFKPTFYTFARRGEDWIYCGTCFLDETEHRK